MDLRGKRVAADFTWTGSQFARGVTVEVGQDGRISSISTAKAQAANDVQVVTLPGRALMPGFINAHSHAFQRGLRAEAQRFDTGAGNFWSWRETMYRLADALDVDSFYLHSRRAFEEMLAAGITSVGEFHYLHHGGHGNGNETDDQWAFDEAILAAARDAGIRICLIQTYYATGNVNQPLAGAQKRFGPVSREAFTAQLDRLASKLDPAMQSLALACHSIRAVDLPDLRHFRDMAAANDWPFHIHVEEVRKEIEDCRAAYGAGPMATLLREIKIDFRVTAIHCTHSTQEDLREWLARGGRVCLCPITEGNLSDGFADVPFIRSAGGRICFGSDSNIRISAAEELRLLEFGQRARREARGIVVDSFGSCAAALMEIGTTHGADSLKLNCGEIAVGKFADFVAIDLTHSSMLGCAEDAIADCFLFGGGNEVISQTWVGGNAKSLSS